MADPQQTLFENDIAVVAYSCVLPGADDADTFWKNCLEEKSQVRKVSASRLIKHLNVSSTLACEIDRVKFNEMSLQNELSLRETNRLTTYAFEAMRQLSPQFSMPVDRERCDLILGCMNPDTDYEIQVVKDNREKYFDQIMRIAKSSDEMQEAKIASTVNEALDDILKDQHTNDDHFFCSSILGKLSRKFGLRGENFIVDAACASTLVAIDLSMQRLRLGQADLVISGGMESNLGPGAFTIFSKVGALAPTKSWPFDEESEGLIQGEGAVFVALKRLKDARRDGDSIHAIIRSVSSSSDGRSASLFQPTTRGQTQVFSAAYGSDRGLDYLEAHGTGTQVGDRTEKESIATFFKGHNLAVGSVKALIGHTKSAAGGAGLLKSLLVIKNRKIPPSSYGAKSLFDAVAGEPHINTQTVAIEKSGPIRVGINSFGFGGTNFHLALEEFKNPASLKPPTAFREQKIIVAAESRMEIEGFSKEDFFGFDIPFKMPPNSIKAIDKTQLLALLTTWNCVKSLGPNWKTVSPQKICVVSSCSLCLDQAIDMIHRLVFETVSLRSAEKFPEFSSHVQNFVDSNYSPINEDAATGILNNVIAGRVCNAFDYNGKSYNIDKDTASVPVGLQAIANELTIQPDQVFIHIGIDESLDRTVRRTKRHSVTTRVLTTEKFIFENELPSVSELSTTSPRGVV